MGQSTLIATFLITLIFTQKNAVRKSIYLSLLVFLKTFLAFSLFAFIKRNKKIFLYTLLSFTIILSVSFLFIKPDWYIFYIQEKFIPVAFPVNPPSGIDYYNQSLRNTMFRLGVINLYKPLFTLFVFTSVGAIIVTQSFSLSIIFSILLSTVSWQHYFVMLFPIFVIAFLKTNNFIIRLLLLFAGFLWWIEFPHLHQVESNFINGLLASHYFFSGLLLAVSILLTNRKTPHNSHNTSTIFSS
jgi:hypothetical protein